MGANQGGISVVNFGRSTIEDNNLNLDPKENAKIPDTWLQIKSFRRTFRRSLLHRLGVVDATHPAPSGGVTFTIGGSQVWLQSPTK